MAFSPVPAPNSVRQSGLPYAVAQLEPRQIVASFADEVHALAFCDFLNGKSKAPNIDVEAAKKNLDSRNMQDEENNAMKDAQTKYLAPNTVVKPVVPEATKSVELPKPEAVKPEAVKPISKI